PRRVDLSLRGNQRRNVEATFETTRHTGSSLNHEDTQMLIPSIDLQGGAVVQLIQGERLAIRDDDVSRWGRRFSMFPKVQVIHLDAAMSVGDNLAIVQRIAGQLTCRVGGGIRTVERAQQVLEAGARQVIAGPGLFKDGGPDLRFAQALADEIGAAPLIAAVDSRDGHVVIHGWKTPLSV